MNEPSPIVLVVDDEIQIRRFLRTGFELNGFVVHEAGTGAEAIRSATLRPIDLVIVDLGLPDMDGSEVVERIRSWSSVPIIVLSVRSSEAQKVHLLELGADDYVVKPFGMAELLARVRVALRRQMRAVSGEPTVKVGPLTIDLAVRAVTLDGARLTLTPKEYRLLQVLAQHAGNVVTHQHLLKEVWGYDPRARHALSAHLRAQAAAEDRAASGFAQDPGDRTGRRLPAGAVWRRRQRTATLPAPRRRPRARAESGPAHNGGRGKRRNPRLSLTICTLPRHKHGHCGPSGPHAFSRAP